jgi:hypothetical protein
MEVTLRFHAMYMYIQCKNIDEAIGKATFNF